MKNLSRRSFLKSSAAAGVGVVFIPNLISAAPSDQLRFAMIGVGGRGQASWSQVPVESLVAMCDVDDRMSQQAKRCLTRCQMILMQL